MSMENAILAHAAALEKLAAAIQAAFAGGGTIPVEIAMTTTVDGVPQKATEAKPDAELDAAVSKVEDAAKEEKKTKGKPNAQAAPNPVDTAAPNTSGQGADSDDAEPLDYVKDVRPKLLAVIKKVGKEPVLAVIKQFGVEKAEHVDPAKFPELLAEVEALAA